MSGESKRYQETIARIDGAPTVGALETIRNELVEEKQKIEAQLAEMNKTTSDGQRLSGIEYHQWRSRAVWAVTAISRELRYCNDRLKKVRREHAVAERAGEAYDLTNPTGIMRAAHRVLKRLHSEVELEEHEMAVMDALRDHLAQYAPIRPTPRKAGGA